MVSMYQMEECLKNGPKCSCVLPRIIHLECERKSEPLLAHIASMNRSKATSMICIQLLLVIFHSFLACPVSRGQSFSSVEFLIRA